MIGKTKVESTGYLNNEENNGIASCWVAENMESVLTYSFSASLFRDRISLNEIIRIELDAINQTMAIAN